jgi:hypothetical protein
MESQTMAYAEAEQKSNSSVMEEISRLGNLSQSIAETLDSLGNRLEPVLGSEEPMPSMNEVANYKSRSQIAEMLNTHNNMLENIHGSLHSLLTRLDV